MQRFRKKPPDPALETTMVACKTTVQSFFRAKSQTLKNELLSIYFEVKCVPAVKPVEKRSAHMAITSREMTRNAAQRLRVLREKLRWLFRLVPFNSK
jgi:hypothetical protein